jgi:hypothetical protein
VKQTQQGGFGTLDVILTGEDTEIDEALKFIESKGVTVEVTRRGE